MNEGLSRARKVLDILEIGVRLKNKGLADCMRVYFPHDLYGEIVLAVAETISGEVTHLELSFYNLKDKLACLYLASISGDFHALELNLSKHSSVVDNEILDFMFEELFQLVDILLNPCCNEFVDSVIWRPVKTSLGKIVGKEWQHRISNFKTTKCRCGTEIRRPDSKEKLQNNDRFSIIAEMTNV